MMNTQPTLYVNHLNDKFLNNFIDCCLVKPYITPTSGNTQIGYGLWKGGYKYALREYISQYVDCFNALPSDVHRIESPPLSTSSSKKILNIVKFPNLPPHIIIKKGNAILLNKYPRNSDAGYFGNKGDEWGDAPTKYRSLRFLRTGLYWPYRTPLVFLHQLQQHTNISDKSLSYLCRLVWSFLQVHQFPPNLIIVRELINKLPKSYRSSKRARGLMHIIKQLEDESRARQVFQKVDYVVQQSYFRQYIDPRDGWHGFDNIWLIPDKEKYEAIYKLSQEEILPDVYALEFIYQQQTYQQSFSTI